MKLFVSIFCLFSIILSAEPQSAKHRDSTQKTEREKAVESALKISELVNLLSNKDTTPDKAISLFRNIIKEYKKEGVEKLKLALQEVLKNNDLSRSEIGILLAVLEAAVDENIFTNVEDGPFIQFAKVIHANLVKRVIQAPEVRAVAILANQTLELLKPSGKDKKGFARVIGRFRKAIYALGDEKIDGDGIMLIMVASFDATGTVLGMVVRRLKGMLKPQNFEKTLKAIALLANTAATPDPILKAVLRELLGDELEKVRLVNLKEMARETLKLGELKILRHILEMEALTPLNKVIKEIEKTQRLIDEINQVLRYEIDDKKRQKLKDNLKKITKGIDSKLLSEELTRMVNEGKIDRQSAKSIIEWLEKNK